MHQETRRRPPLYGARTWRELAHLLSNLPVGAVGFVYTVTVLTAGIGLAVTLVGLPLLACGLVGCRGFGRVERGRARALLGEQIPEPPPLRERARRAGLLGWLGSVLGDGLSWRSALHLLLMLPWGVITFVVGLVSVVALWPLLPWIVRGLAAVDRALASGLLAPTESELKARVRELEEDRGAVVDTAAADLRRIERDLHDGAQARLVSLAMDLGLAKEKLQEDPGASGELVGLVSSAHGEAKLALQELRDLARGIHPAVLTDRGLDAALSSVAARCAVPEGVRVSTDLPEGPGQRPDSAVEGIAYFIVSELLVNVSKHAGARSAVVDAWRKGDRLMLRVSDDGSGGAVERAGGGLAGLAERVRAVDGVFLVESPVGGGTTVTVELPWRTRRGGG